MKKLLFLALLFVSCEKDQPEPTYCYMCLKEIHSEYQNISVKVTICDVTESQIERIIIDNTGELAGVTYTMKCTKQPED